MFSFDRSLKNLINATFMIIAFVIIIFTMATLSMDKQHREKEVVANLTSLVDDQQRFIESRLDEEQLPTVALTEVLNSFVKNSFAETAKTLLIDQEGTLLWGSTEGVLNTPVPEEVLISAMEHTITPMYYRDYRDVKVVGAYRWVNNDRWLLVTEVNQSEGLAPFYQIAIVLITVSVFLCYVIYLFLTKLYNHIQRPIQTVAECTIEIASGNYSTHISPGIIANSPVEWQKLCHRFNEMSKAMKTRTDHLNRVEQCYLSLVSSTEQALSSTHTRFRSVFESSGVGIALGTQEGEFVYLNPAFSKLVKYEESELLQMSFSQITHPEDLQKDKQLFEKLMAKKVDKYQVEKRYYCKDRSIIWVCLTISIVEVASSAEVYIIAMAEDITEKKNSEEALKRSEQYLSHVVETIPSGVMIINVSGNITFANSMATEILGLDRKKLLNGHYYVSDLEVRSISGASFRNDQFFLNYMIQKRKQVKNLELLIQKIDGKLSPISLNATPLLENDEVTGILVSIVDISERIKTEQKLKKANRILEKISMKDALTEIANRRQFNEVLEREWSRHMRTGKNLSIIMFDIDHFKEFNDTYGHQLGDECLISVANTAQRYLKRPGDLVARYGGEEFIIILPETDLQGALHVGERIRKEIENLETPHRTSNTADVVTISVGVATSLATDHFKIAQTTIEQADKALYKAKLLGRNRVELYQDRSKKPAALHSQP